jgi:hypothetical protein
MRNLLLATIAAVLLSACSEKAPRADPEKGHDYNGVNGPSQLFERTQTQGESERMGY